MNLIPIGGRTFDADDPKHYWFCECETPAWDGMQCGSCYRKPRTRMVERGAPLPFAPSDTWDQQ